MPDKEKDAAEEIIEELSDEELEEIRAEADKVAKIAADAKKAADKATAEEKEKKAKLDAASAKKAKEKRIAEMKRQFTELKKEFDTLGVGEKEEMLEDEDIQEVFYSNASITSYAHHGAMVRVHADLKGKHRQHSLCYQCQLFKPDTLNNCHIAQAVFENCKKYNLTTPVWECPEFKLTI